MTTATEYRIVTNNVPRDVLQAWELTAAERKELDYLDWPAIERGEDSAEFFRYRGQLYPLSDFSRIVPIGSGDSNMFVMRTDDPDMLAWDGYASDSFFSGIVIRWARDDRGEPDYGQVIVGTYLC